MRTLTLALAGRGARLRLRRGTGARRQASGEARRPGAGKPAAPARKWVVPRTPDGKPDLQGNWTNATITPLERLGGSRW